MFLAPAATTARRSVPIARAGLLVLALATAALPVAAAQLSDHAHQPPVYPRPSLRHVPRPHGGPTGYEAKKLKGSKAPPVHLPPGRGPLEQHHWPDRPASHSAAPMR